MPGPKQIMRIVMIPADLQQSLVALLKHDIPELACGGDAAESQEAFQPLFGDGSSRRFIRVFYDGRPRCIAVAPASADAAGYREFRSSLAIGRHLHKAGVPVPEVLAADTKRGLIVFEDLGDTRLHGCCRAQGSRSHSFYQDAVKALAHMQVVGAEDFDQSWCCDTETYDKQVMTQRESGYFYQAFWKDTLFGGEVAGLEEEFELLAERVMDYFEPLFLHRDFQSRNIMIKDETVRIIDFQAGRLGPPGYDIASLLIDPYVALSVPQQDELFELYLVEIGSYQVVDPETVRASYPYLALQRNLQIIGAFAYLSGQKRKTFFRPYLLPSLIMLQNRLSAPMFADFPIIRQTAAEAFTRYRSQPGG